jgi:hypothetical protein
MSTWNHWLTRWAEAGLIDGEAAARIRDYETEQDGSGKLRWPVLVAIAFGAATTRFAGDTSASASKERPLA